MPAAQFFERGPSKGALQSQLIGQGLGQVGGQIAGREYQRGMIQDALEKVGALAKSENANPTDVSIELMKSLAGVQGAEKYIAPMAELLTRKLGAENVKKTPPPPGEGNQLVPERKPSVFEEIKEKKNLSDPTTFYQTAKDQLPNLPEPMQTPDIFHGDLEPSRLGMGPLPNTYTPEQIAQVTQEDLSAGFPQSQRAALMEKYNELARNQIQDYENAVNIRSNVATQQRQSQEAFRNVLKTQYGLKGKELSLAETIANEEKFKNIGNDQIRAERVMGEMRLLQSDLDLFNRDANRPNPYFFNERYNQKFKPLQTKFNQLASRGLRDQALEALSNNGWSNIEIEQISNPLGEKLKKINTLPTFDIVSKGPQAYKGESVKAIKEKINTWKNEIPKIFETGTVDPKNPDVVKPGTSLTLLMNEYLKKNGNYLDFSTMINDLVDKGKIKLDPFQTKELNKINQPPVKNMTIEEFMFGTKSL